MDTRNLKQRLQDPEWVKDWSDQAGGEAVQRIEELERVLQMVASKLRSGDTWADLSVAEYQQISDALSKAK